jgi:hypothetical protein
MSFVAPPGYPFAEDAEDHITKIGETEWNQFRGAVNDLIAAGVGGDFGGGSPLFAWKAGRYYSIQQLYAAGFAGIAALTANSIYATPLYVPPGSGAIDRVGIAVQTGAGTNSRLMYFAPGTDGHPDVLLFDFGTVNTSTSGDKEITVSQTLPEGPGWLAVVPDGAINVYTFPITAGIPGNANQGGDNASPYRANGGTTAPNPFGTSSISYLGGNFVRLAVRAA